MIKAKVRDKVRIICYTSMGTDSESKVTKITKKYDEDTGKPYNIIWCGKHGFDARNGDAVTVPYMYYIVLK